MMLKLISFDVGYDSMHTGSAFLYIKQGCFLRIERSLKLNFNHKKLRQRSAIGKDIKKIFTHDQCLLDFRPRLQVVIEIASPRLVTSLCRRNTGHRAHGIP